MDKKKLGTLVGVVGVAGVVTAAQMVDLGRTNADYMTKDLVSKFEESKHKKAEQQSDKLVEKVYDPVQKVEYVLTAQPEETSAVEASVSEKKPVSSEEIKPVETVKPAVVQDEQRLSEAAPERKQEAITVEVSETKPEFSEPEESVSEMKGEETESVSESQNQPEIVTLEEQPREFYGVTTVELLNVRASKDTESDILDHYLLGSIVRGKLADGWIAVELGDGVVGYVNASFVKEESKETVEQIEATLKAEEERKAAEEAARKAEEERKEAERKAAEEAARKAEEERREAERKAAEEAAAKAVVTRWTTDALNVRATADINGRYIRTLSVGTKVSGNIANGWMKLSDGSGYVSADYLTETEPQKAPEAEKTYKGYASVVSRVRAGAGQGYEQIGLLQVNDYVEGVLVDGWVRFTYEGRTGYVKASLLSEDKIATHQESSDEAHEVDGSTIERLVSAAHDMLGKPYLMGEESPDVGFDCSGLVYWLYRSQAGITLNRTSSNQASNGYYVSRDNLQPGDLLFFSTYGEGISHVGMYVGEGMMIHAEDYGTGVVKTSIYKSFWSRTYVTARRILN